MPRVRRGGNPEITDDLTSLGGRNGRHGGRGRIPPRCHGPVAEGQQPYPDESVHLLRHLQYVPPERVRQTQKVALPIDAGQDLPLHRSQPQQWQLLRLDVHECRHHT